MISNRVKVYLAEHTFCSEYLFKDWQPFLELLYAEGGHVSSILWWDHCRKSQLCESVGSGGYRDPDNDEFTYAETQLYKEGLETYTLDEIKQYINHERKTGFQLLLMKSSNISIMREKQVSNMAATTGATIWCPLSIW